MENRKLKEYIAEVNDTDFSMRNQINIDSNDTFGIEVEFENVSLSDIKYSRMWFVKTDDTVTIKENGKSIGGEVSSPVLKDNEECWREIEHVCNYLSKKGAIATPATGGHIHIGSQVLKNDPNNIRKLLKEWELFEPIIYSFSSGNNQKIRSSVNKQAQKISAKLSRIRTSKNGYNRYKTYYDWCKFFRDYNFGKFGGINFKNYKGYERDHGNTIEIRCPNGTIDPVIWQNNINFFIKFLEYATTDEFDEEYIDYLLQNKDPIDYGNIYDMIDVNGAIELADLIFKDRVDKIMFLKQYLKIFDGNKQKQYAKK